MQRAGRHSGYLAFYRGSARRIPSFRCAPCRIPIARQTYSIVATTTFVETFMPVLRVCFPRRRCVNSIWQGRRDLNPRVRFWRPTVWPLSLRPYFHHSKATPHSRVYNTPSTAIQNNAHPRSAIAAWHSFRLSKSNKKPATEAGLCTHTHADPQDTIPHMTRLVIVVAPCLKVCVIVLDQWMELRYAASSAASSPFLAGFVAIRPEPPVPAPVAYASPRATSGCRAGSGSRAHVLRDDLPSEH